MSSYDFCVRNDAGDLIYAEGNNIGVGTNLEVEVTAMWQAVRWCRSTGYNQVTLETQTNNHWCVESSLGCCKQDFTKAVNVKIIHVFREANHLADLIKNIAINQADKWCFLLFHNYQLLPKGFIIQISINFQTSELKLDMQLNIYKVTRFLISLRIFQAFYIISRGLNKNKIAIKFLTYLSYQKGARSSAKEKINITSEHREPQMKLD